MAAFIIIVVVLLLFFGGGKSTNKKPGSSNRTRVLPDSSIDNMDGHDFEYWCADLLRYNGFSKIEVTKGSNDQGVDIIAVKDGEKYAIQCKRYSKNVGNKAVQEVSTGKIIYGCSHAIVMTNSYFTLGAITAAKAVGVTLWDRNRLSAMIRQKQSRQRQQSNKKRKEKRIERIEQKREARDERRRKKKRKDEEMLSFSQDEYIDYLEAIDAIESDD